MMPSRATPRLIDLLPPVRGRYSENAPLATVTWFRVGGPAEVMFRPADLDDLAAFRAACPSDVPVTVIGVGSNLLVRDGGVPGVVVRLGRAFARIDINGEDIDAGAACLDSSLALAALAAGLTGIEFLSGIPGSLGGAVRMNAGAYESEIADLLIHVDVVDGRGGVHRLAAGECGFGYRRSGLAADWIVAGGRLRCRQGDRAAIAARMEQIRVEREDTQPVRSRTGGSTFANPPGAKAWELIHRAGCRGLRIGGAEVSTKHCNFLINTGDATAADLEALGEEVRARVVRHSGVTLEWEIRRIGVPAAPAAPQPVAQNGGTP